MPPKKINQENKLLLCKHYSSVPNIDINCCAFDLEKHGPDCHFAYKNCLIESAFPVMSKLSKSKEKQIFCPFCFSVF